VKKGARVEGASIVDVMPTILYAMGEQVPDELDGRVLDDIFDPEFLKGNPVHHRPAVESPIVVGVEGSAGADTESVRRQLAALGYIE
jgi:arylsulfatase A-like enzyme